MNAKSFLRVFNEKYPEIIVSEEVVAVYLTKNRINAHDVTGSMSAFYDYILQNGLMDDVVTF